jgi:hypothetical protein
MEKEEWKDIEKFEDYYKISSIGRVLSLDRRVKSPRGGFRRVGERILKTRIDKYGYDTVILRKEGKDKHFTIHRLVAMSFIKNINNYPCINHKDEDKENNFYKNLEWCSVKYNNLYNKRQEKITKKLRAKKLGKPIEQYDLNGTFIKEFSSLRVMYREVKFSRQLVREACLGIRDNYKGYIWKYKKNK